MNKRRPVITVLGALMCALIGAGLGIGVSYLYLERDYAYAPYPDMCNIKKGSYKGTTVYYIFYPSTEEEYQMQQSYMGETNEP